MAEALVYILATIDLDEGPTSLVVSAHSSIDAVRQHANNAEWAGDEFDLLVGRFLNSGSARQAYGEVRGFHAHLALTSVE
jgi:hypothetical protein